MKSFKSTKSILILGSSGLMGSAIQRVFSAGPNPILTPKHKELNLENQSQVFDYFDYHRPHTIIHAAGVVGGIIANIKQPYDLISRNIIMLSNAAAAADRVSSAKVVLFGSSCLYPKLCEQPMKEEYIGNGQMEPTSSAYASSKLAAIELGMSYNRQYASDRYLCVIPNSTYGPHDNFDAETGHVLSALIGKFHHAKTNGISHVKLWGTGSPFREFIFSDDVAEAIKFLLNNNHKTDERPINIGTGQDTSIFGLAEIIKEVVEYNGEIVWDTKKPDGAPRKLLDSSQIFDFGWQPRINITEGIKRTYNWYINHHQKNQ